MLKTSKLSYTYHVQAALDSLNALCRKPLATLMTIIIIAIALALPTLFYMFTYNINKLTTDWHRAGNISLYLKSTNDLAEQKELVKKIEGMQGVGEVSLKSPAQGLAELTQQEGMHDIMRYLPENPLPPVIEVVPALTIDSPTQMDLLARQLQALTEVDQVKMDMGWVSKVHAISDFISNLSQVLILILSVAVIMIVGSTMRFAIHNRHEEIQILKLIGATDSYIMRPFLYTGIWYCLAGAIIAVLMVNIIILSIGVALNQLAVAYQMHYPLQGLSVVHIFILIGFAILLGWVGANLSVKRQLSSIEPYN